MCKLRALKVRWSLRFHLQMECTHIDQRSGAKTFRVYRLEIAWAHLKVSFWRSVQSPTFGVPCVHTARAANKSWRALCVYCHMRRGAHAAGVIWEVLTLHGQRNTENDPLVIQQRQEIQPGKSKSASVGASVTLRYNT